MKELEKFVQSQIAEQYRVIDEIWRRRVNYASVADYYDKETVKEIVRRMPNLLVKGKGCALDELADEYGFESTCDLVDLFVNYENKAVAFDRQLSQLIEAEFHPNAESCPDIHGTLF